MFEGSCDASGAVPLGAIVAGTERPITAREWDLLEVLASDAGRCILRERLLQTVWGRSDDSTRPGLALIGHIARCHGGSARIERSGKETILRVELPRWTA